MTIPDWMIILLPVYAFGIAILIVCSRRIVASILAPRKELKRAQNDCQYLNAKLDMETEKSRLLYDRKQRLEADLKTCEEYLATAHKDLADAKVRIFRLVKLAQAPTQNLGTEREREREVLRRAIIALRDSACQGFIGPRVAAQNFFRHVKKDMDMDLYHRDPLDLLKKTNR